MASKKMAGEAEILGLMTLIRLEQPGVEETSEVESDSTEEHYDKAVAQYYLKRSALAKVFKKNKASPKISDETKSMVREARNTISILQKQETQISDEIKQCNNDRGLPNLTSNRIPSSLGYALRKQYDRKNNELRFQAELLQNLSSLLDEDLHDKQYSIDKVCNSVLSENYDYFTFE